MLDRADIKLTLQPGISVAYKICNAALVPAMLAKQPEMLALGRDVQGLVDLVNQCILDHCQKREVRALALILDLAQQGVFYYSLGDINLGVVCQNGEFYNLPESEKVYILDLKQNLNEYYLIQVGCCTLQSGFKFACLPSEEQVVIIDLASSDERTQQSSVFASCLDIYSSPAPANTMALRLVALFGAKVLFLIKLPAISEVVLCKAVSSSTPIEKSLF